MTLLADVNITWYLPPLIVAISLVYGATRYESWQFIFQHAILWSLYILTFLGGAFLFLYLIYLDVNKYWYPPLAIVALLIVFYSGRTKKK